MLLGFAVKSLAHPELKSHDSRRWQNQPHLSVSLAYLRDLLTYLAGAGIGMYRMSADLAPYAAHPDMPQFHSQLQACTADLREVGAMARQLKLRLSFHVPQQVLLNSPDDEVAQRATGTLGLLAGLLEAMGLGSEAVVVTHLGGLYGDREASRARFALRFASLPETARQRLVLENDDMRYGVDDIVWVHERTGIRLVFDYLHHRLNHASWRDPIQALAACLATWPPDQRPKIHFSSPRTEWHMREAPGQPHPAVRRARWSYHSDFANPFEFGDFLSAARRLRPFDVMLELRAKDLALLRLAADLRRFAPELAEMIESPVRI